ncbi:protein decapentaplegic-like [Heptranchias perlo]|uniref:protein decapentaplegic-like n=1 Tax=Heptranchias perlo TaxID=212740 RepID=UPI00355958D8
MPPLSAPILRYAVTCLLLLFATGVDLRMHNNHRKWLQIEAIKRGILNYLGLEQPPVIRKSASREEEERMYQHFLQRESEQHNTSSEQSHSTASVRSVHVLPVEIETARGNGLNSQEAIDLAPSLTLCFPRTKAIYPGLKVVRAELKFYKGLLITERLGRVNSGSARHANVYEILEPTSQDGEHSYRLLDSKPLDSRSIITFSLNIRPLIQRWTGNAEQHIRVELEFHPPHPDILVPILTSDTSNYLRLEVETEQVQSITRERRATNSAEDCQRRQRSCCRKTLQVSFKEIGWSDWIRAPESYNMYNCGGSCPANYKPANMHAMIKSAMHQLSGGASPGLCCIPAAYEPMTLLHYSTEGKLTLTAFEGMIVTNCHCS